MGYGPLYELIFLIDSIWMSLTSPRPGYIIKPNDEWHFTKEWQKMEREAEADLRDGRYEDFANIDQVIHVLKQTDPTARLDQTDRIATALRRFRRRV